MTSEVLMPALSPTMTEGRIARWVKSEGDTVHAGDVLAEIETDKATMEVEAVDEGVLAKIVIPEGTDHVLVNTPIAQDRRPSPRPHQRRQQRHRARSRARRPRLPPRRSSRRSPRPENTSAK